MYLYIVYTWYVVYALITIGLYWNIHVFISIYYTYLYVLACIGLGCKGLYLEFTRIDMHLYVL